MNEGDLQVMAQAVSLRGWYWRASRDQVSLLRAAAEVAAYT
jgi:hypothetical protein